MSSQQPLHRLLIISFKPERPDLVAFKERAQEDLGWFADYTSLDGTGSGRPQKQFTSTIKDFLAKASGRSDEKLILYYDGLAFNDSTESNIWKWHPTPSDTSRCCPQHTKHVDPGQAFQLLRHSGKQVLFLFNAPFSFKSAPSLAEWCDMQATSQDNVQIIRVSYNELSSIASDKRCRYVNDCERQSLIPHARGRSAAGGMALRDVLCTNIHLHGPQSVQQLFIDFVAREAGTIHTISGEPWNFILGKN